MKNHFKAFCMCQSMFCAIPFPWNVWEEKARDKMLLFLPVVGLEIGLIWYLTAILCSLISIPAPLAAAVMAAIPFALTGCIHLDGFMDVTDAVRSCRDLEKRRQILKDPHVGSFAVIGCMALMLFQYGSFLSVAHCSGVLIFLPAVSRCCSALAITVLTPMSTSQYAAQKIRKSMVYGLTLQVILYLTAGFFCFGLDAAVLVVAIAASIAAISSGYRNLGGMNGDISGYAITLAEVFAAAALAVMEGVL